MDQRTALVGKNNRAQFVTIPLEYRFPEGMKDVFIRKVGDEIILSPRPKNWSGFLAAPVQVSDDIMVATSSRTHHEATRPRHDRQPSAGEPCGPLPTGAQAAADRRVHHRGGLRAGSLFVLTGQITFQFRQRIGEAALQNRLPTMFEMRPFADAGGLMSYGADLLDFWRQSARFVDKLLKGAKPADLPVEQPKVFELVINLKTAKALGITIPQKLLLRADDVIR